MIKRLSLAVFATIASIAYAEKQPNILIILADDLGYRDLSVQGSKQIKTPHIDRIFDEGVRFTSGYVTNSVCAPSRAGLLTGRLGSYFGFEGNLNHKLADRPDSTVGLPLDQQTIANHLETVGYTNYCIGKWHLGNNQELFHPLKRGFHEFYGLISGSRSYWPLEQHDPHKTLMHNYEYVNESEIEDFYVTDVLTDRAITYIQKSAEAEEPFFMYLSYTAPHGPMHAKESDLARVQHIPIREGQKNGTMRRTYGAMVQNMDDNVGRVLETLEAANIDQNTFIVFLSDNGGPTDKNGSSNWPLHGKKGSLWEGGIRIPFGIRWPEKITGGQVLNTPVISADLLPTFSAISGLDPETISTEGKDLMPLLDGSEQSEQEDRSFFWRRGGKTQQALYDGKFKYQRDARTGMEYLFDVQKDSAERKDLSKEYPEITATMRKRYDAWQQTLPPVGIGIGADPK